MILADMQEMNCRSYCHLLIIVACLSSVPAVSAQSAAAIVSKHLEAMGGRERLSAISALSIQMDVKTAKNSGYIYMQLAHRRGILVKNKLGEFTNSSLTNRKGIWIKGPSDEDFREVRPVPNRLLLYSSLEIYEHSPPLYLLNYDQRGLHLFLQKRRSRVNKTSCYVLEVKRYAYATDSVIWEKEYYIGKKDYLLHRIVEKNKAIDFSKYLSVQGIMVPHQEAQTFQLRRGINVPLIKQKIKLLITQIEINPIFSEDFFTVSEQR